MRNEMGRPSNNDRVYRDEFQSDPRYSGFAKTTTDNFYSDNGGFGRNRIVLPIVGTVPVSSNH